MLEFDDFIADLFADLTGFKADPGPDAEPPDPSESRDPGCGGWCASGEFKIGFELELTFIPPRTELPLSTSSFCSTSSTGSSWGPMTLPVETVDAGTAGGEVPPTSVPMNSSLFPSLGAASESISVVRRSGIDSHFGSSDAARGG